MLPRGVGGAEIAHSLIRAGRIARLNLMAALCLMFAFSRPGCIFAKSHAASTVIHGAHQNSKASRPNVKTTRQIAVAVNGNQLDAGQSAEYLNGRVYVPLRAIVHALHLGLRSQNGQSIIDLPSQEHLALAVNSRDITLEKRRFRLDVPVLNLQGRTFIPVELFLKAFGALVRYDDSSAHVAIFAHLENRPHEITIIPPVTGTLTNVDLNSNPAVISLMVGDQVRTLNLPPGTPITIEDLVAGTIQNTTLTALHPGDLLTVRFGASGGIAGLADSYRSRNGVVAAVSTAELALQDGHVIIPSRSTTVVLNGAPTAIGHLRVGDSVTIRSNPESLEVREILATRALPPSLPGPVAISQVALSPEHPLKAKEELLVFLRGTPNGKASFDLGATAINVPMSEIQNGLYRGQYLVVQGASFLHAPVIGSLQVAGISAQPVSAATNFSAATLPPQIVDIAPNENQAVNDTRATIYATFTTPTGLEVDPDSIHLSVNGRDVTALTQRAASFVSYEPPDDLPLGVVPVALELRDVAGNLTSYHWSFICGSSR